MTQLLIQTSAPDYAAWKAAFDAEAENIAAASLNTLQIWKGEQNAILVLFEVANRKNAQAWLDKQTALGQATQASSSKPHDPFRRSNDRLPCPWW